MHGLAARQRPAPLACARVHMRTLSRRRAVMQPCPTPMLPRLAAKRLLIRSAPARAAPASSTQTQSPTLRPPAASTCANALPDARFIALPCALATLFGEPNYHPLFLRAGVVVRRATPLPPPAAWRSATLATPSAMRSPPLATSKCGALGCLLAAWVGTRACACLLASWNAPSFGQRPGTRLLPGRPLQCQRGVPGGLWRGQRSRRCPGRRDRHCARRQHCCEHGAGCGWWPAR